MAYVLVVQPKRFGSYYYRIIYNGFDKSYLGEILILREGVYKVIENSPIAETKDEAIHFAKKKVIWVTKYSKGLY